MSMKSMTNGGMSFTHHMSMSMTYKNMSLKQGMHNVVLNFTRDVNYIPMTCMFVGMSLLGMSCIGDAPPYS
jgi:hypothetical protein